MRCEAPSRLRLDPGGRVLVIGDGVIGAPGALGSRARGFEVCVVGRRPSRLATLRSAGVAAYRAGRQDDVVRELCPDAVIDWSGSP